VTNVLTVSVQPSTRTNSNSFSGSEITSGDSIIMPIAISTDDTTRSITRNGMNSMQPIWNEVLSSLSTKAASLTVNAWSLGSATGPSPASEEICCSALLWVCASMNRDNGTSAILSASSRPIWSRS